MSSLTVHIGDNIKSLAQKRAKQDGVTLTFIISQALQAYNEGKLKFGILNSDDEITASFDVSTSEGKRAAIASFESIGL